MTNEKDDLLRVAAAVADGVPVDWHKEDQTNVNLKRTLNRLRDISRIAEVHRSSPSEGVGPSAELDPTDTFDVPAAQTPVPPLPFTRWGHLEVHELIGRGGFGEVYRAWDPHLRKEVALKLVRADRMSDKHSTARFLLEARRLARVTHENVLQVHGADVHEGRAGLWTDLIKGRTLEKILHDEGRRGWEEAVLIGLKMCKALAAVHFEGLIHHDVKTSNIMRGESGRYILMDFSTTTDGHGTGRAGGARSEQPSASEVAAPLDPHAGIGTPGFMAPERFRGADSGPASDIYSLGVVLYRLVSGSFPVEGRNRKELYEKHCRDEATPLRDLCPDLPDVFVQIVERALDREPGNRFRSIGEMDQALAKAQGDRRRDPVPEPPPQFPSWAWLRRIIDTTQVRAAAVLIVAVIGGIYLANLPRSLQIEAVVIRAAAGGEETLSPGTPIALGDQLSLDIRGNGQMHVYVLNLDAAGEAWILFPLPIFDLHNPIAGGATHRLPGTQEGRPIHWVVSSAHGEDRFLVIASRDPLKNFERQISAIPTAGSVSGDSLTAQAMTTDAMRSLRGIGRLEKARGPEQVEEDDAWKSLRGIVDGIKERAASDSDLWAWEIDLQNPGAGGGRP